MNACEDSLAQSEAHRALFYRDSDEYVGGILDFIRPGLERNEPVAIAVPAPKLTLLRAELGPRADAIELLDMFELGRNPGRIIPAVLGMIGRHTGKPLRYVGEPIWPGRSLEEIQEATRHEALINLAWPDADISVLCPYDAEGTRRPRAGRRRAHAPGPRPRPAPRTQLGVCPRRGAGRLRAAAGRPAAERALRAFEISDLGELRMWVAGLAAASGLDADRAGGLVIAINELTTNTVKHADTHGVLRFWQAAGQLIFQIEDAGHIADPLAGRRHQITGAGGLGLWMVNQLCDLVEVRTSRAGTTIRVHASCGNAAGHIGLAA